MVLTNHTLSVSPLSAFLLEVSLTSAPSPELVPRLAAPGATGSSTDTGHDEGLLLTACILFAAKTFRNFVLKQIWAPYSEGCKICMVAKSNRKLDVSVELLAASGLVHSDPQGS